MHAGFDAILFGSLVVLLGRAAWRDLALRIISNRLNLAIAALAPLSWWSAGIPVWPDIALQIGLAAIVFALFAVAFALGMMGGGDVKLIAALALWRVPLNGAEPLYGPVLDMLMIMAVAGGVLTVIMLILHRRRKALGQPEIPYGVAIAIGAAAAYAERYLNHFS